jgi:hypothetical protein
VFARLAGARRLPLTSFLLWAVAARSTRFAVMAGMAAMIGRRFPSFVACRIWSLTLLWAIAFGLALWRTIVVWERRGDIIARAEI